MINNQSNYYFSFGPNPKFPYQNGWICITAPSLNLAIELYNMLYPNPNDNVLVNCSFVYTEDEFKNTNIYKNNDNLGAGCHKHYTITITDND